MPFPSSGVISSATINTELGFASTATLSLNDTAYRNRVLKPTANTIVSFSDAYEFVLTISSPATNLREPTTGSNYTQNSTDWQANTSINADQVRWGGTLLAQIGFGNTSWTSGSTTYYRDTLVTTYSDSYGTVYYYRIYRNTASLNASVTPNVRTLAINAGWNQSMRLVVNIASNTTVSSGSTATPALDFSGSFPNGVILINNGRIIGMGGKGGDMQVAGSPGGNAINNSTTLLIYNYGIIAGGGGGGGAGAYWAWNGLNRSTPGSGGASGHVAAAGGGGGPNTQGAPSRDTNFDGLFESPGLSQNWGWGGRASSPGGQGGAWGAAGDAGGTVDGVYNYTGYAGGAAGKAVNNTGTLTWGATGTTYGATA
jgi:hypothetical protein